MASHSTPQRAATSRLLAMKFMNRLGPASGDSSPASPSSQPNTPTLSPSQSAASLAQATKQAQDGRRSAKRRKVSLAEEDVVDVLNETAGAGASVAEIEASMKASMEEEERRRQAAVKKRAAELGDEQWTWDRPLPPSIAAKMAAAKSTAQQTTSFASYASAVHVGFAEIDTAPAETRASSLDLGDAGVDEEDTKPKIMRFNMKSETVAETTEDDENPFAALGASRKRSRSDAGPPQRKKETTTKLKNLTSLSSQGGQNSIKCHRCGRSGHKAASCPSSNPKRANSKKK